MPDATITSTASTFGTISGTFAADQSTVAGTVYAITGTVNGSVGVPGPQGPTGPQGPQGEPGQGVPAGGTAGQFLTKTTTGVDYATNWSTLSLAGYATESWVTAGFYPLTGNPSGFITASALTPYLQKAGGYITGDIQSSNGSAYRTWNGTNLTGIFTPGSIVFNDTTPGHGSLTLDADGITFYTSPYKQTQPFLGLEGYATESWVNAQGFLTDAPSDGSQYARQDGAWSVVSAGGDYLPLAGGTMTGPIVFDGTSGQYISKGNFDSGRGGNYGISLVCSIGYEFNWQAGWLTTTNQGNTTPRPLYLDSLAGTSLRVWDSATDTGVEVSHTAITFADATTQTTAFPGFAGYATESWVTAGFYPLTGNPSGFLTSASLSGYATESYVNSRGFITSSALTPYLTSATAASTYAVIAAGQPVSGTVGQVLTKNSGTSYDSSWQTLIPGDRYLTTSTTSNAVSNGAKTFTVQTGLSYTTQQDVVIAYDATHHMHALVTSYNSTTGVLVVDVQQHTGSGTFTFWTINVGGTVPLQSVVWGDILGTLGDQSDLATALNAKLEVTDAAATYYPLTNPDGFITSSALTGYATESWVTSQGYLTDAPSDGVVYGRQNASWVATGSSSYIDRVLSPLAVSTGELSIDLTGYATESFVTSQGYATESFVTSQGYLTDAPNDGQQYARQSGAWAVVTGGGGGGVSWGAIAGTLSDQTDLQSALNARLEDAPSDGTIYGRFNGTWTAASGSGTYLPLSGGTMTGAITSEATGSDIYAELSNNSFIINDPGNSRYASLTSSGFQVTNSVGSVYINASGISFSGGAFQTEAFPGFYSAALTGQPTSPLPPLSDNSTRIANTTWVKSQGFGGCNVQTFGSSSSSGTFSGASGWQKPAGAKWVEILLFAGGGGGGSGARQPTTSARFGGGGGGGGSVFYGRINAAYLGSTETVVIGAAGNGGASRTTDATNGASAQVGGATTFSIYQAVGGVSGSGGTTTGGTAGAARNSTLISSTVTPAAGGSGTSGVGAGVGSSVSQNTTPLSGGGGAGAAAASTANANGGAGAAFGTSISYAGLISAVAGGAAGNATTLTQATAGTSATTQYMQGGTGGGGGYYITATAGGTGGAGGWPGGAGGGGGASDNGFASGAGGAGANGFAVIITYF